MSDSATREQEDSYRPWLYRWTLLVLGLVWPLVWVGSLVTTQDAGMSVPDWPNTYGDNLFLYPLETWLSGPFDLFIEHGHRLLGALVGFVAIIVVAVAFWTERRRWVQVLAVLGLVLIIVQGILGGMRVVLGDRLLAMTHGCTAPIVFALFTILAVVTSRWWSQIRSEPSEVDSPTKTEGAASGNDGAVSSLVVVRGGWLATVVVVACYFQLVLGAMLRHVSMEATPGGFTHTVAMHVLLAFVIWGLTAILWLRLRGCGEKTLSRPGGALVGLVAVQIALGLTTWVVHYGFPMFQDYGFPARYLVQAKSFWGSFVICGHVATGSLILATAVLLTTRTFRIKHLSRTSS